ncbi:MAG: porin [Saprospiraceae bacterium]
MKKLILPIMLLIAYTLNGQVDSTASPLTFTGYAEVYYAYDFNQPDNHERPSFFYNFNRHNEVNLNLGFINANYTTSNLRGNLGLMVGTWAQYNSSAEQGLLKNVWQANVGVKLCKEKNFWLDAGIFPSHIGFESPIGKADDALTRCIMGDNTPSWESGVKIGYTTDNGKWFLSGMVINGWQRIARVDGNNTPAFGTQITYTPSSKFALNYSTFIGSDKPDVFRQMRYYHNFFALLNPTDKLRITLGFDYCMEQKSKGSSEFNNLLSPAVLVRLALNDKWSVTGRGEYYADENGIIIATGTPNGFKTSSFSLNLDRKIGDNAMWRIEGRMLNSKDKIFNDEGKAVNTNTTVTTSLAISF